MFVCNVCGMVGTTAFSGSEQQLTSAFGLLPFHLSQPPDFQPLRETTTSLTSTTHLHTYSKSANSLIIHHTSFEMGIRVMYTFLSYRRRSAFFVVLHQVQVSVQRNQHISLLTIPQKIPRDLLTYFSLAPGSLRSPILLNIWSSQYIQALIFTKQASVYILTLSVSRVKKRPSLSKQELNAVRRRSSLPGLVIL